MVHQVKLFIDKIHFGLAIYCADGWYKFEYASSGTQSLVLKSSKDVTIKRTAPTGNVYDLGETKKGLQEIIEYARIHCGFHGSDYNLFINNCRKFCRALAQFLGVLNPYESIIKKYHYHFA